jgi:hypothetical protein
MASRHHGAWSVWRVVMVCLSGNILFNIQDRIMGRNPKNAGDEIDFLLKSTSYEENLKKFLAET